MSNLEVHFRCSWLSLACAVSLHGPALARAAESFDDFEAKSQTNLLGGAWTQFADASSIHTPVQAIDFAVGYASSSCGHFGYALGSGTSYPYAGVATGLDAAGGAVDLSDYVGVRFWAKGAGNFVFAVGTTTTMAESNHYGASLLPTLDWAQYQFRFSDLSQTWGTKSTFDAKSCTLLQWTASGTAGDAGELFLDDVELITDAEVSLVAFNPVVTRPKVNQLGYLPAGAKRFTVTLTDSMRDDTFRVLRVADDAQVFTGSLSRPYDERAAAGEAVARGDFSSLMTPGRYYVAVGSLTSAPFEIGGSVYAPLYRDAVRAFYLIRSGVAIDDPQTGIQHAASHTSDAVLRSDPSQTLELTGGWYNAGDFGKWSHMAAISSSYLMWLYELGSEYTRKLPLAIPESDNGTPDLLDQARWGLEWLLKMQRSDGSVIHKVDSEPNFAWGLRPEDDPNTRYASATGTIDTANFAAVMTQAVRVFQSLDAPFAARCSSAAERAFAWVDAQPAAGNSDPYYTDPSDTEERLWALAERASATRDAGLLDRLEQTMANTSPIAVSWMNPSLLGYLTVARSELVSSRLREMAAGSISALADHVTSMANANGYGVSCASNEYYWGSVENVLHSAAALLFAHWLSNDSRYRDSALAQLDYVLGVNSLDRSFVTGFGDKPVLHPYHWTAHALHVALPGWASGGPNAYASGADLPLQTLQKRGTPPAKCFVDEGDANGSAASNEGQTTENAVLSFVTGYLAEDNEFDAGPPSHQVSDDAGVVTDEQSQLRPAGGGCRCSLAPPKQGGQRWWSSLIAALICWRTLRRNRA